MRNGKPKETDVQRMHRLTRRVMAVLGRSTVQEALTITTNVAGHLCAQVAQGKPSAIQSQGNSIAEAIKTCAINKILYDDEVRRKADSGKE